MPELGVSLHPLLRESTERLRQAGIAEPRRETLRIWNELAGGPSGGSFWDDFPVDAAAADRFHRAVERREAGEPLSHVTGRAGFRYLSLRSDSRALIPRPETEGLVDLLLQRVRSGIVADVGTGSGCIALSLAQEGAFTQIVATDWSKGALALARLNAELLGTEARVEFVQADLCEPLRPGAFDALVSNPPYLTAAEYASVSPSVRDWEPALALVSGEDGLAATGRLLDQARGALRPEGWLALEVDCSRAGTVAQRAHELGWLDVAIHKDLFGRERYLLARRSNTR